MDGPDTVVARILAAADQLQSLPVGADLDSVRGVFPEAARALDEAGVEVARLLVGDGMWDRVAAPESERDFDLVVRGSRAAIEWLAAKLGNLGRAGGASSQDEVLITYLGQPGGKPAATFLIADAGAEPIRAFRKAARALRGWHVAYTTDGRMAEIFVLGRGADPAEFAARMERVRAAFEAEAYASPPSASKAARWYPFAARTMVPLSPEAEARLAATLRDALTGPLTPDEVAEGRARWEAGRAADGAAVSEGTLRAWAAWPGRSKNADAGPRPTTRLPTRKARVGASRVV